MLKAMKTHLNIDIGSYFLKKCILNAKYPSNIRYYEDFRNLVKLTMPILDRNKDLKAIFLDKVKMKDDAWQNGYIPLKKQTLIPRHLATDSAQ